MSVTLQIKKPVDIMKLVQELGTAGFKQTSSKPDEYITVEDATEANRPAITAVYLAHNAVSEPLPTLEEKVDALTLIVGMLTEG